jgi:hypothetical protein
VLGDRGVVLFLAQKAAGAKAATVDLGELPQPAE